MGVKGLMRKVEGEVVPNVAISRTTDPVNLKSLALIGSDLLAKMYPDRPY